jgi:CheY-like chemotaxis protein
MASLQKTILIAEDSPDDVFLLRCAYAKTGLPYDLRFVCNGREAIDYLEGNPPFDRQSHPLPAAIILDIQMPLLTGLEVLAWLKLHPTLSPPPAVVHSSSILDIDRNKIAELGARKCFVKSPNQDDQIAMFQSIAAFITDSETSAAASTALDAEHFTVLEGTLQIATCYKTLDVPAGATVSLSRGVPHAWCNLSDVPLRVVIVFSPGQIEGMLREVIGWNVDDVSAILDKFGCLIVGPALIDNTSSSNSPSRSR